jgi:hypothetical protein
MDAADAGSEVAMARSAELGAGRVRAAVVFGKLTGTGELWIAKAGARHSKSDVQMIQAMHDTAMSLGAACAKPEASKVAKADMKDCPDCTGSGSARCARGPGKSRKR